MLRLRGSRLCTVCFDCLSIDSIDCSRPVWNANTIAHNFIHLQFFRSRALNTCFRPSKVSCWAFRNDSGAIASRPSRDKPWRWRWSRQLALEFFVVLALESALLALAPKFFLATYLPDGSSGSSVSASSHFEHGQGATSHYGRLYNLLFFNDGYHVEHHARPASIGCTCRSAKRTAHGRAGGGSVALAGTFQFGWIGAIVLLSTTLQRFVLKNMSAPFARCCRSLRMFGGLLLWRRIVPRTALILQRLLPSAQLTIIDASAENLRAAVSL